MVDVTLLFLSFLLLVSIIITCYRILSYNIRPEFNAGDKIVPVGLEKWEINEEIVKVIEVGKHSYLLENVNTGKTYTRTFRDIQERYILYAKFF